MRCPPLEWDDLIAMGMDAAAIVSTDGARYDVQPPPPKLLRQLMAALAANPAPTERLPYLRHVRDLLMSITDWTQAPDSPLTSEQRVAWADYRQSLRDLPSAWDGAGPVPWPDPPVG